MKRFPGSFWVLITIGMLPQLPAFGSERAEPPNIVIVLMDNMGYGELGVYGGGPLRGAETPRIDALARDGLRLLNFNVEAQCTPTRAALMTGRYAVRTGNPTVPRDTPVYGLVDWELTLAELLSEAGYTTGIFGKWHLGQTPGRYPTDHGFDVWYGLEHSSDPSHWSEQDGYDPASHPRAQIPFILRSKRGEPPRKVKKFDANERRLVDRQLTREAIAFIREQARADRPFFAYVPYSLLHWPVIPHPDYLGSTGNGRWADALAEIDANVGQLLDAIGETGVADDTLFIFSSDGGPDALPPNVGSSGPWRGTYMTNLEGGIRVPFLARWPGVIPKGRWSNGIVHITDVFATIAGIVGFELPDDRAFDGVDQYDHFTGKSDSSPREHVVIYVNGKISAVKWRHWKLHFERYVSGDMYGDVVSTPIPHLFDLYKDPKEQHNVMLDNTWIRWPVNEFVNEHRRSLERFPPILPGTADPYRPENATTPAADDAD